MNRYHDDVQAAIARLGDRIGELQSVTRNLASCRDLSEADLDPESELALICWLEEAADLTGAPRPHLRLRGRPSGRGR
jgi:hypothetical protein